MIGTDIVHIPRFQNQPNLAKKILSQQELEKYHSLSAQKQTEFLAGRFAAKEALAKATGFGLGNDKSIKFQDISILSGPFGEPVVNGIEATVSISHDGDYAIAVALLK